MILNGPRVILPTCHAGPPSLSIDDSLPWTGQSIMEMERVCSGVWAGGGEREVVRSLSCCATNQWRRPAFDMSRGCLFPLCTDILCWILCTGKFLTRGAASQVLTELAPKKRRL